AGSLTGAEIGPGWMSPARHAYLSAFQSWHRLVADGLEPAVRPRVPRMRAFAAPRGLAGDAGLRRSSYDVILAGDWRAGGDIAWPVAERVLALVEPGRTVAVLHLDTLAGVAGKPAGLDPALQQMINTGIVDQVVLADDVHARLVLVHDPAVLGFAPGTPSAIRAAKVVIEAAPAWLPAAAHCASEARRLFSVEPHWAPTDRAGRDEVAAVLTRVTTVDVPGTVDLRRWRLHRSGPRADRPVIGRVHTGGPADWRRLTEALGGTTVDVRVLALTPPDRPAPDGWLVYHPSDVDIRGFLHQLDFYLYLPSDEPATVTCPEILTAMAAGCIPLLPHGHAAVFGPAALYADPAEIAETAGSLHRGPAALLTQSERGRRFLEDHHQHRHYADAVAALLKPAPTSADEVITGEIMLALPSGEIVTL
ncbi:MAG TPA: glycosyltransferase family 2 protein, partial [Actinoplanes sp.]|nr:glycosyltransferase family 2 protein [Actinoplanes sp.]